MSEFQIGSQESRPEDLQQKEAKLDAAIEVQVKHNMGDMSKFMTMMKGNNRDFDMMTEMGAAKHSAFAGAMQVQQEASGGGTSGADFASGGGKGRRKGSQTLSQLLSTTDALGHKRSRSEIQSRYAIANAAWSGHGRKTKFSEDNSKDFMEEIGLLKMRMASLPKQMVMDKSKLNGAGLNMFYAAYLDIQREKESPAMSAVVSGTMNDMDKFKDRFKGMDSGVKEQVYAQASTQGKQKLATLMS